MGNIVPAAEIPHMLSIQQIIIYILISKTLMAAQAWNKGLSSQMDSWHE